MTISFEEFQIPYYIIMLYFPYMQKNKQIRWDHNINLDLLTSSTYFYVELTCSCFIMFGFVAVDPNDPGFRVKFLVIVALYTCIMSL